MVNTIIVGGFLSDYFHVSEFHRNDFGDKTVVDLKPRLITCETQIFHQIDYLKIAKS